jgi:hypothetical protein
VVNQRIHRQVFEQIVPGALADFDLPDLVSALAPRPTWLINATDPLGNRMRTADVRRVHKGATLRVQEDLSDEALAGIAEELSK